MTEVEPALRRLRAQLPQERFFGEKSSLIRSLEPVDEAQLPVPGGAVRWWLLKVSFGDRAPVLYSYFVDGETLEPLAPGAMGPLVRWMLVDLAIQGPVPTREGRLSYRPLSDPASWRARIPAGAPCRPVGVEQSNSSVILAEQIVHKHFRAIQPGENPDVEMPEFLWGSTSFHQVPRPVGVLEYTAPGFPVAVLGSTQEFERNEGDLWSVGRDLRAQPDGPTGVALLRLVEDLGRVTASLHVALAGATEAPPAFRPEPLEASRLARWKSRWSGTFATAMESLDRALPGMEGPVRDRARALQARSTELESFRDRVGIGEGGRPWSTRIHGDYHLGQVLSTHRGPVILDFEGEPARPLSERREKHPPLRDVAGMLRSLDYLARSPGLPGARVVPESPSTVLELSHRLQDGFLKGYSERLREERSPVEPPTGRGDPWLAFFVVEKALYEIRYELDHRPSWVSVPLGALEDLLGPSAEGPKGRDRAAGAG